MDDTPSFGYWIRRRRKALDLTQEALAQRVGCSLGAIRKLESDERRPSPEMAERLALVLELPVEERTTFLTVARTERAADQLVAPTASVVLTSRPLRINHGRFPVAVTPLIGRASEVAAVRATLEQPGVRLLTLTGPGGTGKTRLAIAVVSAIQDDVDDEAAFVDLAPIREPGLVLVTIAAALGIAEQREQSLLMTLQDTLHEMRLLLVLDNFEQVVSAAPDVAALLKMAPGLRLLVTSRIVLGVSGEHVVAVPPLELLDAARLPQMAELMEVAAIHLFVDRAMAANSAFSLTEAHAPAVVDICRRLDGLPLALELAAARTRVLSPAALALRLEQRLPMLVGGARDLPVRQQTLRAAIDWSYELLAPVEQRLFRRLAIFVGGWTLEAAEAVCGDDDIPRLEVVDKLQTLLENSLVLKTEDQDGRSRFRMYETIREYALECLATSGESLAVGQQHASYYLQLAETAAPYLTTAEQSAWLTRLGIEHDNLRAVLSWCEGLPDQGETMLRLATTLKDFWWLHLAEGMTWIHRALAHSALPPSETLPATPSFMQRRARGLMDAAHLALIWGDHELARSDNDECIALFEKLGDTSGLADALMGAGNIALGTDTEAAIPLLERSAALYRSLGDNAKLSGVLCDLGAIARFQGNYAQGDACFIEALSLARAAHDGQLTAIVLENIGALALHQQAPDRAVATLEESVLLLRQQSLYNPISLGWALLHLAEARRVASSIADGTDGSPGVDTLVRRLWEEALALLRAADARWAVAQALLEIGEMLYEQGDDIRAAEILRESVAGFHELGLPKGIGYGLDGIAALWASSPQPGALERAVRLWSAATLWHRNKPRMSPIRPWRFDRMFAAARADLGEEAYVAAWSEGQAMPLEQAIAYALEEINPE